MPPISATTTVTTTATATATATVTTTTTLRRTNNRRRFWRLRKSKKLPTVRLGGERRSDGSAMVRLFRRIRIRWMKLKKARLLKKLKEYYLCVLKDLTEHDRSLEKHQQVLLMETSFAVPVMGIPINSFR